MIEVCTRPYDKDWLDSWIKAEESLGLKKSKFIIENGMVTQFVDEKEAENFHEYVKEISEEIFDLMCDNFFDAIKNEDKIRMFKALSIFDEMDNNN